MLLKELGVLLLSLPVQSHFLYFMMIIIYLTHQIGHEFPGDKNIA